ncbi:MAG: FAD:protein FMN transferase, partial [Flavobacteriales bacterium]|nr:FAD:protein FMN transferase [Flavobacteriales bacterium]
MKKLFYLLSLLLISCGTTTTNKVLVSNYGYTQGTTYNIRYMSADAVNYQSDIDSILHAVDQSLSTYVEESVISKINKNESMQTDSLFMRVFEMAVNIAKETDGAFDPTIAPVVNFWGFGFEEIAEKDERVLADLMKTIGYEKLTIKDSLVVKSNPNTQIDFNAIAQGFTVDLIGEHLQKLGLTNYMIEIGGELKCHGLNADGELWRIGIDKPSENIQQDRFQAIIEVTDKAVASSGNYRKFKVDEETGMKYAHTINPKTGKPIQTNLLSVTIVSESCMQADALATACMIMGVEKSIEFINSKP